MDRLRAEHKRGAKAGVATVAAGLLLGACSGSSQSQTTEPPVMYKPDASHCSYQVLSRPEELRQRVLIVGNVTLAGGRPAESFTVTLDSDSSGNGSSADTLASVNNVVDYTYGPYSSRGAATHYFMVHAGQFLCGPLEAFVVDQAGHGHLEKI